MSLDSKTESKSAVRVDQLSASLNIYSISLLNINKSWYEANCYLKTWLHVKYISSHNIQIKQKLHRIIDRILFHLDQIFSRIFHLLFQHERLLLEHIDLSQNAWEILNCLLTGFIYWVVYFLYEYLEFGYQCSNKLLWRAKSSFNLMSMTR